MKLVAMKFITESGSLRSIPQFSDPVPARQDLRHPGTPWPRPSCMAGVQ
jgi:hypothetical protein